ncbi:MAG: hypothetical protein Fur0010_15190 [Bdellovibrio sp.]
MKKILGLTTLFLASSSFVSCDIMNKFEQKAAKINRYEQVSLALAKENRELKVEISQLKYEIESLKSKNNFLTLQLDQKNKPAEKIAERKVASTSPVDTSDLVQFDTYKWTPTQLLSIAEKEFEEKNFEKSSQYFKAFDKYYSSDKRIDDQFLFRAGMAAFESKKHYDWSLAYFDRIVADHPNSPFYRGAKLWRAMTYLEMGDHDRFFETVEEFRKKYRNTEEWKILSHHYEKIMQKYKRN